MKKGDNACRAIRAATTEAQVIAAVRDYLASLEPSEVAALPQEIMTLGFKQAEEVVQYALQLVHDEMLTIGDSPAGALLKEIALVFSTAARRLAALAQDAS